MSNSNSFELELADSANSPSQLFLRGRVTVASAADIHHAALQIHRHLQPVVIDCTQAEYIDGAVMQVIIALGREMSRDRIQCDLRGLDGPATSSFRMCGMID